MLRRVINTVSFLLAIITFISSPARADHFRFVSLEFPPLEYVDEQGQAQGIAVDLVKEIMTNLGHTVDVTIYPWARSLHLVKDGHADAIFTAYKNPEREKFLDYSNGVLAPQIVAFYARKDSNIVFDGDIKKLKNKTIGTTSTISYGTKFDNIRDQLTLEMVQDLKANFKKLKNQRIDLVISNIFVGDSIIKELGMEEDFKKLSPNVQSVNSYIGFSKIKGLSELRDQFDNELIIMKANGKYDEITAKYGIRHKINSEKFGL